MYAENSAGARASVSCKLETYDITLPTGRVQEDFKTSSNPKVLKASVLVHDDSEITDALFSVGYGPGQYGDQVVPWMAVNLKDKTHVPQGSTIFYYHN